MLLSYMFSSGIFEPTVVVVFFSHVLIDINWPHQGIMPQCVGKSPMDCSEDHGEGFGILRRSQIKYSPDNSECVSKGTVYGHKD